MQSVQQQYVYNQTAGAVTATVNGNWLQAYCEYLGVTQPVNNSWLQALCVYFGITEPLYGSWTIALANFYGITTPAPYGTWWNALANEATPPVTELIWNTTDTFWNLTDVNWATGVAPTVTLSINMYDGYGDGWTNGYFQLERENAPGVWEPIEFNENAFTLSNMTQFNNYMSTGDTTGIKYYKTDPLLSTTLSGPYGIRYERYEPGVTNSAGGQPLTLNQFQKAIGLRTLTIPQSGNYRTISMALGQYPTERSYEVLSGTTPLAVYGEGGTWTPGTVQTTFTLL